MLVTQRKHLLAEELTFVGFDSSEELVDGLSKGEIDALVVQNPRQMAYRSVETLVRHLRGEEVPPQIDTGVRLVTSENLDQPEIQELIK